MALENVYAAHHFTSFNLEKLKAGLDLARIQNQTVAMSEEIHYVTDLADISDFPLPIVHEGIVYVDAKPFTKLNRDGTLQIRDVVEHSLRLDEARWELVWTKQGVNHQNLMTKFPFHHEIFSQWVADAVTSTYSLTPYQSNQVKALAGLFSIGQFINHVDDDMTAMRFQLMICEELNLNIQTFESVTGHTEFLIPRDIKEFVEMVVKANISTRLDKFNVNAMLQGMSSSFFGVSYSNQLTETALEYPPSLFVIMRACLENNFFNRCRMGALIKKSRVAKRHDSFIRSYDIELNQNTKPVTFSQRK